MQSFIKLLQTTNGEICVVCPTQRQAALLINLAMQQGLKWHTPTNLCWDEYGKNTCYFLDTMLGVITYSNVNYAKKHDYKIYKLDTFEEFVQSVFIEQLNTLLLNYPELQITIDHQILILSNGQILIKIDLEQNFISFTPNVEQNLLIKIKQLLEEQTAPQYHIRLKFEETHPYLIKTNNEYKVIPVDKLHNYNLKETTFTQDQFEQIKKENRVFADIMVLVERLNKQKGANCAND